MTLTTLTHATLVTLVGDGYGLISDGALAVQEGAIAWLGEAREMPERFSAAHARMIDCRGALVTPGLIDCHTHTVYAGDRAGEFEQRLEGASYADIAAAGGGILSTVSATRQASREQLLAASRERVRQMMRQGVTTLEIKSGYGLDRDSEMRMLEVAGLLADEFELRIQRTFLGAHALPPEYADRKDAYIDAVCNDMLPAAAAAGLVDAVDAFCEGIAFSVAQVERVFDTAERLGLPVKLHAEQLSDLGGAAMAARREALSVDHLEFLSPADIEVIAASGTVAVLLPGAFYTLRETRLPPVDALREHGVPLAVATDCNPGSSPLVSLPLAMNMACTLFGLTPREALAGTTVHAARALGLASRIGTLEVGKQADLAVFDLEHPAAIAYHVGLNACTAIMTAGAWRPFTSG